MNTNTPPVKTSEVVSVSVPPEMKEYLDNHTKINRSKLFQDAVNNHRYPQPKKASPQTNILCLLGLVVGVCIMMVSLSPFVLVLLGIWMTFALILLGMALSIGSIFTIFKSRKELKKQKVKESNDQSI